MDAKDNRPGFVVSLGSLYPEVNSKCLIIMKSFYIHGYKYVFEFVIVTVK